MKNIQNARCSLEKLLNEECDQTTYYQNIGRLEIDNFDEHAIDLTKKTMYSFENGETICFIMRKFIILAMKHCRHIVLPYINYIRKLVKEFIFQI